MRFKRVSDPPTERELRFQPHQFYDDRLPRVPNYSQRGGYVEERDRSLYGKARWRFEVNLAQYRSLLKGEL